MAQESLVSSSFSPFLAVGLWLGPRADPLGPRAAPTISGWGSSQVNPSGRGWGDLSFSAPARYAPEPCTGQGSGAGWGSGVVLPRFQEARGKHSSGMPPVTSGQALPPRTPPAASATQPWLVGTEHDAWRSGNELRPAASAATPAEIRPPAVAGSPAAQTPQAAFATPPGLAPTPKCRDKPAPRLFHVDVPPGHALGVQIHHRQKVPAAVQERPRLRALHEAETL